MLGAGIGQVHLQQGVREVARFDFVGKQRVRWDKGGTVRAENYIISYDKGMKICWAQVLLCTTE